MHWSTEFLVDAGLSQGLAEFLVNLLGVVVIVTVNLLTPVFTIYLERKVAARFQDRIGPNRVGPRFTYGALQSVPDVIKLLLKEIIVPRGADLRVYLLAPILMVVSVILIVAAIPWAPGEIGADLSIGILYVISVSSLSTIAILMGGWGSNNKYALLGAFRVIAQLVSYEVPMVLALLLPVMIAGTMSMQGIVEAQDDIWFIYFMPLAAAIFFISAIAEVGRQPFDLLEAESEIVAGYNIEYSGMPFAMFYLGEWLHAFLICMLMAVLFLGGWQGPFVEEFPVLGVVYLYAKTFLMYFVHMWIRYTVPRLRIDHLMAFNWKFLVPVSVFNLLVVAFIWKLFPTPADDTLIEELPRALAVLAGNIALTFLVLYALRVQARRARRAAEDLVKETPFVPLGTNPPAPALGAD